MLEDGAGVGDLRMPIFVSPMFCNKKISVANAHLEDVLFTLTSSVGDLAVVEDDTVATSTTIGFGPADMLRELGIGVGKEELHEEFS